MRGDDIQYGARNGALERWARSRRPEVSSCPLPTKTGNPVFLAFLFNVNLPRVASNTATSK